MGMELKSLGLTEEPTGMSHLAGSCFNFFKVTFKCFYVSFDLFISYSFVSFHFDTVSHRRPDWP